MSAAHTIPQVNEQVLAAFFARLERAVDAAFPVCAKCGHQIVLGEIVNSEGTEHIHCPVPEGAVLRSRLQELLEAEDDLEWRRR